LTIHLRATAGEYELLLESASVRGVSAAGEAAGDVANRAGRDLPLLDLAMTLSGAPVRADGVVILYATGDGNEQAVRLAVDEVKGLLTLAPDALARLPAISARFGQLFDAIAIEPIEGRHALRLRARLDLQAIGQEDA